MTDSASSQEALVAQATSAMFHLVAAKYFQLAAFVMLLFDHLLTLDLEVERIWKRTWSGATILFMINRYGTPIQFAFILAAFHDPSWSTELCNRVVKFEGYTTVVLVAVCELIMILRMYALYSRNVYVLGGLFAVLAFQIILSSYGLSSGVAVPLPPGVTGCILTGPVKSATFPAVWYTPAITDAIIFALTVYRAKTAFRSRSAAPTIRQFVKDGVLYFLVIFAANLSNVLTFAFAVDDLKAFGASFSQLITSVMISRLLLNLRGIGEKKTSEIPSFVGGMQFADPMAHMTGDNFFSRTIIGNLGEDIRSWGDSTTTASTASHAVPPLTMHLDTDMVRNTEGPKSATTGAQFEAMSMQNLQPRRAHF